MERRDGETGVFMSLQPPLRNDLERPRPATVARHDPSQHLFLRPERLNPALAHHQQLVDACNRAGPMRDNNDDTAPRPHAHDGAAERFIALRIEIGVRLIENDRNGSP